MPSDWERLYTTPPPTVKETRRLLDWLQHKGMARKYGMVDYVCKTVARETGAWQRPVAGRL